MGFPEKLKAVSNVFQRNGGSNCLISNVLQEFLSS